MPVPKKDGTLTFQAVREMLDQDKSLCHLMPLKLLMLKLLNQKQELKLLSLTKLLLRPLSY